MKRSWRTWSRARLLIFGIISFLVSVIASNAATADRFPTWVRIASGFLAVLVAGLLLYVAFSWAVAHDRMDDPDGPRQQE